MFRGDVVAASEAYHEIFPEDELVSLVDYNNDVITDSLKVARAFGKDLNGVRVDTSRTLVDRYFLRNHHLMGTFDPRGANPELIIALRNALDKEGYSNVQIVVSGGFDRERIETYERLGVPVDMYGVRTHPLNIYIVFCGDNILLNRKPQTRKVHKFMQNTRLQYVK